MFVKKEEWNCVSVSCSLKHVPLAEIKCGKTCKSRIEAYANNIYSGRQQAWATLLR